jgi:hypothetical protein
MGFIKIKHLENYHDVQCFLEIYGEIITDTFTEFNWTRKFPAFIKSAESSRPGALAARCKVAYLLHLGILTFNNLLSQNIKNIQKQNYISYSSYSFILMIN